MAKIESKVLYHTYSDSCDGEDLSEKLRRAAEVIELMKADDWLLQYTPNANAVCTAYGRWVINFTFSKLLEYEINY